MNSMVGEPIRRHRLSITDYHRMGEVGVFEQGARVELIHGEIIDMAPIGSPHAGMVRRLTQLLSRETSELAIVSVQNPIILGSHSEPQPDLALLKPRTDFYAASHPGPEDVLLIVEVSDSSARFDREVKVPLYAGACIPEMWLIDLEGDKLEVYRQPGEEGYSQVLRPRMDESLALVLLPQIVLPVAALWGEV